MEFLKKHYEKILLGTVLFGLTVGAAYLPVKIYQERAALDEKSQIILDTRVDPLPPVDLTNQVTLIQRAENPVGLDLAETNKLFNPMVWQRFTDGRPPIKVPSGGPIGLVQLTRTTPLHTIVTLDSVQTSDSGARYVIGVEREAAPNPTARRKKQYYTSAGGKNDAFTLRDIRGPAENPVEFTLEMNDTGETVLLSKEKPFQRVDGYMADLKYPPENKTWTSQRMGSTISFAGETYSVVQVTKDEVVLMAKSNYKKTAISLNPAPDSR